MNAITRAYLDEQRGTDLRDVGSKLEQTAEPEPPFDAVVERESKACLLPAILLPPLLLPLRAVPPNRPPQTFETWTDLTGGESLVVRFSGGLTCLEGPGDLLGNGGRRAVVLEFVEVGRLERTSVAQGHERGDPSKRQDVPPAGGHLGNEFRLVE